MKFKTNEGIEKRNNNFMHRLFYRTPEPTYELHGDLKKSIGYNFDYPNAYTNRDIEIFETPVRKITVYTKPRCYQRTLIYIID